MEGNDFFDKNPVSIFKQITATIVLVKSRLLVRYIFYYRVIQNLSAPPHLKPRVIRKKEFNFLKIYFKRKRFVEFERMKRSVAVFMHDILKYFIVFKAFVAFYLNLRGLWLKRIGKVCVTYGYNVWL